MKTIVTKLSVICLIVLMMASCKKDSVVTSSEKIVNVKTNEVTEITAVSAVVSASVDAACDERGVCWDKNANPTLSDSYKASGSGLGNFSVTLTDLEESATYHVRAYATNSAGTCYGEDLNFTTKDGLPTVVTGNVSNITATSAECSGEVTGDCGIAVIERGVCWGKNANPTLSDSYKASGSGLGNFSVTLTDLEESATYHVRAYATNSAGTCYGEDVIFTTLDVITFTVNGVSFDMVYIDGGTFTMGATAEQGSDAEDNEKPAHSVTLSCFHIGKFEVTQELWEAVMGSNPSHFKSDDLPVECVNWNGCQTFINKLNQLCAGQLNGKKFSLPTEAQWEYAARGGNKSSHYKYCGSDDIGSIAWYVENSGDETHAVGTKSPNELGLYDMSGSVWEWCQDWYGDYSGDSQTDPTGPLSGVVRVYRGGSWCSDAIYCRVSYRINGPLSYNYNNLGLRLALVL
ncbi:MAG: SUMF1/EgtB/PvdO family nonheme iron enzyme [Bacteroidales bacterium]|nr:SUMF1/EgtB/PvdO family nonheme iron enzyme [Bacteroidales bacterium]